MFRNFPGLKFLWFLAFKITFRECSMLYPERKVAQTAFLVKRNRRQDSAVFPAC